MSNLGMLLRSAMLLAVTSVLSLLAFPLPFCPVPVTGQTLGVGLAGLLLGPRWGAASMAAYLAAGLAGFPVFSHGRGGPGVLFGPTGGYLLIFPLAAYVTGHAAQYLKAKGSRPFVSSFAGAILGSVLLVHLSGSLWLAYQAHLTLSGAFFSGSLPFLPADILKASAASFIAARYPGSSRAI